jgi:tRNA-binding EMAP/Myf-like protein
MSAIELLEDLIADLEAKLNLAPGADPVFTKAAIGNNSNDKKNQKTTFTKSKPSKTAPATAPASDIPEICKLEFKVGRITKVWVHPDADKLYCEEIDCGEADGPRQIASGLRMHYEEEEMLGKRVLVVANLKVSCGVVDE